MIWDNRPSKCNHHLDVISTHILYPRRLSGPITNLRSRCHLVNTENTHLPNKELLGGPF